MKTESYRDRSCSVSFTQDELKQLTKGMTARIKRAERVLETYEQIKDEHPANGLADEWLGNLNWGDHSDLQAEIWKLRATRTKIESLKD